MPDVEPEVMMVGTTTAMVIVIMAAVMLIVALRTEVPRQQHEQL